MSIASARARLAAAAAARLLVPASPVRGCPTLYAATAAGLRAANASSLGPCRVSASNAEHLVTCASVAAALARRYPQERVGSERELRLKERERCAPVASARLCAAGARGSRWHRPDLVLWPAQQDGLPVAVEVELSVKAPRRLEEICRAWARARCVAGVLYLVAPAVESALERAITRANAGGRVVAVPLGSLLEQPEPA
jgi:hypothetical protein